VLVIHISKPTKQCHVIKKKEKGTIPDDFSTKNARLIKKSE